MGAVIAIDYGAMYDAERAARRAAEKCESYVNDINKKVCQKMSSLTLGGNGNTSQADYFARSKINNLNQKKGRYEQFAARVGEANSHAKNTDSNVSGYIRQAAKDFRASHDMRVGIITEFFTWVTTTLLNQTAFGRFLNQISRGLNAWIQEVKRGFKRWYELDGGKYIIKTVAAVVLAIAAAVLLVCTAWPALVAAISAIGAAVAAGAAVTGAMIWTAITAATGFIGAVIGVANWVVKATHNAKAAFANQDDPGWAKCYGNYSSFSDYLRKHNFNAPFLNKLSGIAANIVDGVSIAADLVGVADIARNGINVLKNGGMKKVLNKVHFKSPSGKVTIGTVKYGLKNSLRNIGEMKKLVTNTSIKRLTKYYEVKHLNDIKSVAENLYKWADKGLKEMLKDNVKDQIKNQIKDKSLIGKLSFDIKGIYEKIEKLKKVNKPIVPSEATFILGGS